MAPSCSRNWSDGHNHIYLYSYDQAKPLAADAKLERQLTKGDFEVGDVYRVDAAHKIVDYASNEGNPLEQQIWQVSFDGERKQLSQRRGISRGHFRARRQRIHRQVLDAHCNRPRCELCHAPAAEACGCCQCRVFWETHALDAYHLHAPEQLEVKAHDGTTLYATLLLPAGATESGHRAAHRESLRRTRRRRRS